MSAPRLTPDVIDQRRTFVRDAISRASQRTGVDFDYLLNQAKSESGLNPTARAMTSSASGLFQFIDQTWLGVIKQHGAKHGMGWAANAVERAGGRWTVRDPAMREAVFALRNQAEPAALMAAESASENAQALSGALGRQATKADLYFAHFLGVAGAKRFLRARDASPDTTAASLFPREASVNRGLFYTRSGEARSLDDLYQLLARKINGGKSGDGVAPVSDDPVAQMRMARAGDLVPVPEGSPDADIVRVLSAENMPASTAAPDYDGQSETMMALMQGRSGINMLRPSPQNARLAYLLLAADLNDPGVTA